MERNTHKDTDTKSSASHISTRPAIQEFMVSTALWVCRVALDIVWAQSTWPWEERIETILQHFPQTFRCGLVSLSLFKMFRPGGAPLKLFFTWSNLQVTVLNFLEIFSKHWISKTLKCQKIVLNKLLNYDEYHYVFLFGELICAAHSYLPV